MCSSDLVYMLWMVQRVAFGVPSPHHLPKLTDLNQREMATLVPLVVLVFWIGLFPNPILSRMHASVITVVARATHGPQESPTSTGQISPVVEPVPASQTVQSTEATRP